MSDPCSPAAILDDTPRVVTRTAPWIGVLWISAIPLRLLQADFFRETYALGKEVLSHAGYMSGLAFWVTLALVPALAGRAVFVRSCSLALQSGRRVGAEGLKVPAAHLLHTLYLGLMAEVAFFMLAWLFVPIPLMGFVSCLGAVAATRVPSPGIWSPIRALGGFFAHGKVVIALVATYLFAFPIAFYNVFFAYRAGVWAAGGLAGSNLERWEYLVRPNVAGLPAESLTWWIGLAAATLLVEPFCLASMAAFAHRSRLRETGEDLHRWFESIVKT